MSLPTTTRAWSIREIRSDSFDGIVLQGNVPLPKLGERDVLVKIEAVSLNYRDLAIPRVCLYLDLHLKDRLTLTLS
jgi:hypothetical protein